MLRFIVDIVPTYKAGDPPPEGYNEWHEWAGVQTKSGLKQTRCPNCSLLRFPQEYSDVFMRYKYYTVGPTGRKVQNIERGAICLKCEAKLEAKSK
jgi:hypothetical protein